METNDKETISLRTIIVDYLHHWKLFLVAFLVSCVLGVLYLMFYPKTYEIYSSIQLQDESDLMSSASLGLGEASGLMKSFGLGSLPTSGINLDDEIAILLSTELSNKMVLDLGLNVEYYKPRAWKYKMYEETPLLITADSAVFSNLYDNITLNVSLKQGKAKVNIEVGKEKIGTRSYESLPARIDLEQGTFVLSANQLVEQKNNFKMKIVIRPSRWVAEELLEGINIEEYSKTSNIIEMNYRDYKKKRAIDILDVLIKKYNSRADKIKKEEKGSAYNFIENRINEVIANLVNAEDAIERFKLKNNMTDLTYDIQFFVDQMREIQIKIIEVEAQANVIDLMDAYIKDPANKYNIVPSLLSVKEGENAGALSSYNEALIERTRLLNSTNKDHPTVLAMNESIDKLREGVFLSIANARTGIQMTLNDLKIREKGLYGRMGDVPTQEREFIELKRHQEILQGVYLILLQKREEIALSIGQDRPRASIVDAPFVKKKPVAPRKLFAAIAIFLFTISIPVGYLFFKDQLKNLIAEFKKTK
jgi:uncharacterized protein involved in exopolysaccharide biosynthesis